MPPLQTAPAAGRCSVLGDKHRVTMHRRLSAIILGMSRDKPLSDEVVRVLKHQSSALLLQISPLTRIEPLLCPKW